MMMRKRGIRASLVIVILMMGGCQEEKFTEKGIPEVK